MKIKTFVFTDSIDEDEINGFISDNNVEVISLAFSVHPMHDLYSVNGTICNQWNEYVGVLIYK